MTGAKGPFPFSVAPCEERDVGFVVGYWLDSLYHVHSKVMRGIGGLQWSAWKPMVKPVVVRLVETGRTLVAHNPDDRDHLYGFACASDGALQYVFVRRERRDGGVGRALVRELGVDRFVPATRAGAAWARKIGLREAKR
jgi:GNAT superfamily N-acetyltransferase